jgi:hypothetical protein
VSALNWLLTNILHTPHNQVPHDTRHVKRRGAAARRRQKVKAGFVSFGAFPQGVDWVLLGGFAAYAGAGGVINGAISNWFRDKGFGMGGAVGYIPALIGGRKISLTHEGKVFPITSENKQRWNEWWKFAGADQYGLWVIGCLIWTGSKRAREWRGGDIRLIYYSVLFRIKLLVIAILYGVALAAAVSNTVMLAIYLTSGRAVGSAPTAALLGWGIILYLHKRMGWPPFHSSL